MRFAFIFTFMNCIITLPKGRKHAQYYKLLIDEYYEYRFYD